MTHVQYSRESKTKGFRTHVFDEPVRKEISIYSSQAQATIHMHVSRCAYVRSLLQAQPAIFKLEMLRDTAQ